MAETARFGILLRHYRLVAGFSQEALAERAMLSAAAIAALERGRRRPFRYRLPAGPTQDALAVRPAPPAPGRVPCRTAP